MFTSAFGLLGYSIFFICTISSTRANILLSCGFFKGSQTALCARTPTTMCITVITIRMLVRRNMIQTALVKSYEMKASVILSSIKFRIGYDLRYELTSWEIAHRILCCNSRPRNHRAAFHKCHRKDRKSDTLELLIKCPISRVLDST